MSQLIKKQFELTRTNIFKSIEGVNEQTFDVAPKGFNNTIHWQLGHILVAAEKFLFGESGKLSAEYGEFFGYGTKPADWKGEAPSVAALVEQLKDQLNRIQEIPDEKFKEKLPEPILGNTTYGELAAFTVFHEALHAGQIHAMTRFLG
ncbi:DinB family protein [Calidifontibacillus erzurumensis]|uniref:DinB family protein n=1 Tax=Calidifontibacillus erzurumensis TaxID=2741433 RepID=A0A8J8GH23_9BACI|nr:DinB family protein [Calidifontibacillus erzurumensis]NSL52160.1 DinB family protein [Calidifontibacillus erzurumensis]